MDVPNLRDRFNVGATVPLLAVLFTSAFGLFEAPAMSLQAEFLWVMGIFVIAFLVWLNAATTVQRTREADEKLDKIIQLLANPGTTLEDIKRVISGIDDSFEFRPEPSCVIAVCFRASKPAPL